MWVDVKTISGWWFQPLWKIWKSVGIMKFPTEWKYKIHVPNHQPYIYITGIGLPENQPPVESPYLQVMYSTGIPELRRLFSYPRTYSSSRCRGWLSLRDRDDHTSNYQLHQFSTMCPVWHTHLTEISQGRWYMPNFRNDSCHQPWTIILLITKIANISSMAILGT